MYCTNIDIKFFFSTFKVKKLFIVKDFCYIGKTTRHFSIRVREHLVSDKASRVYKHLASSKACRDSCSTEYFTILDSANSRFKIKIKEALHIKSYNPTVNQQLQHFGLSLSVYSRWLFSFKLQRTFCFSFFSFLTALSRR